MRRIGTGIMAAAVVAGSAWTGYVAGAHRMRSIINGNLGYYRQLYVSSVCPTAEAAGLDPSGMAASCYGDFGLATDEQVSVDRMVAMESSIYRPAPARGKVLSFEQKFSGHQVAYRERPWNSYASVAPPPPWPRKLCPPGSVCQEAAPRHPKKRRQTEMHYSPKQFKNWFPAASSNELFFPKSPQPMHLQSTANSSICIGDIPYDPASGLCTFKFSFRLGRKVSCSPIGDPDETGKQSMTCSYPGPTWSDEGVTPIYHVVEPALQLHPDTGGRLENDSDRGPN